MSGILMTAPALEPVSLVEAKAFLRIEHDDDDDVIAALIAGARIYVEAQTRRALITQSWRLTRDAWPQTGRIVVRPAPLQSLAAARVHDGEGEPVELDVAGFFVDGAGSELVFAPWVMPPPGRAAGIELDVTLGFGDAAVDVPEPLRQAIRLLVGHWYENRGLVSPDAGRLLPLTVAALLSPYRIYALELTFFECPGFGVVLFHALWSGEPQAINGFADLSGLIMAYMAARFGVLGVYVSGRSKEKRVAVTGQPAPSLIGQIAKMISRRSN